MYYFPLLPVLKVFERNRISLFQPQRTYLIGVQHLMETTGSLIEAIIEIGILPEDIFLLGKIYSSHQETINKLRILGVNVSDSTLPKKFGHYRETLTSDVQKLWSNLLRKIKKGDRVIILDDGGYCLKNVPNKILQENEVVGIEQTTSGIRLQKEFEYLPVIDVASSKIKITIEPWIVIDAIYRKNGDTIKNYKNKNIGIVGYGNIGKILYKDLVKKGYKVSIFDKNNNVNGTTVFCKDINELFLNSDLILGCTGEDFSQKEWLKIANGNKLLLSFSSGDIEFNSLLQTLNNNFDTSSLSPLSDLTVKTENGYTITVKRGGFVANFDGSRESSPDKIIQLTRGLLFSAFIQSFQYSHRTKTGKIPLDNEMQEKCLSEWEKYNQDFISEYQLNELIKV